MLYVGIDVAKTKHDYFIINSDGEHLAGVFTIDNSKAGFQTLFRKIKEFEPKPSLETVRVGLEATGHYSLNLIAFLDAVGLYPVVLNPLHTNLYRKGQSLRKTKTDKVDARFITKMLMTENYVPHSSTSYHITELKYLTRHRHRLVKAQSTFKVSYARQLDILFPELAGAFSTMELKSVTAMLLDLPGAKAVSECHLTHLTNLLSKNSHGRLGRAKAIEIRDIARNSIGQNSNALSMELQQTIRMMQSLRSEIETIDAEIKRLVDELAPPILAVKGIGHTLAAIIIAEIGDIHRFGSAAKLQAYAGLDPSTYQSGNFNSTRDKMVKRGSTYLRWALLCAGRLVSIYDKTFAEVLARKQAEGKHYNVAVSHVAKKLIRVIYHLMVSGELYVVQA